MIPNVFFATTIIFLALGFFLMEECSFLIPYRQLLLHRYATSILEFAGLLFVNLFALLYLIVRKLLLKDTGKKLAHMEKQLRTGSSLSEELSRRLNEDL